MDQLRSTADPLSVILFSSKYRKAKGLTNTRATGDGYEKQAVNYLRSQGYRILETNYRNRGGEIDIIALEKETLVFLEVKYRTSRSFGSGMEAVGYGKQRTISRVARHYMMVHGYAEWYPCRFDVVSIDAGTITLIRNAFEFRP